MNNCYQEIINLLPLIIGSSKQFQSTGERSLAKRRHKTKHKESCNLFIISFFFRFHQTNPFLMIILLCHQRIITNAFR